MAEQMLNISDRSTSTQQAGSKRLSQIVRGNMSYVSSLEHGSVSLWEDRSVVVAGGQVS